MCIHTKCAYLISLQHQSINFHFYARYAIESIIICFLIAFNALKNRFSTFYVIDYESSKLIHDLLIVVSKVML